MPEDPAVLRRRKRLAGFLGGLLGLVCGSSLGGFVALTAVLVVESPWSGARYAFDGLPVLIGAAVGAALGAWAGAWGSLRSVKRRR